MVIEIFITEIFLKMSISALPNEIIAFILELTGPSAAIASRVCSLWYSLTKEHILSFEDISSSPLTIPLLEWIREEGYSFDNGTFNEAVRQGNLEIIKYLHLQKIEGLEDGEASEIATYTGNLEVLKYLYDNDYPLGKWCCLDAAEGGHLEVLKYLLDIKGRNAYNEDTLAAAAKGGNLEIVKYLLDKECPWDEGVCASAVEGGHLEVLKYLHSKECPQDEDSHRIAIQCGHLEILKWLHENGCPRDDDACYYAVENGYPEILEYLHQQGFSLREVFREIAIENGHLNILKFLEVKDILQGKRISMLLSNMGN